MHTLAKKEVILAGVEAREGNVRLKFSDRTVRDVTRSEAIEIASVYAAERKMDQCESILKAVVEAKAATGLPYAAKSVEALLAGMKARSK